MPDTPDTKEMDLDEFLASASRSFTEAQQSLLAGTGLSSRMMLGSAELEVKVAMDTTANGGMVVRPISLRDMADGLIKPDMLSTVRINLVGSIDEAGTHVVSDHDAPTEPPAPKKPRVPDLSGLTLKDAYAKLQAEKWTFSAHAAPKNEAAKGRDVTRGKVIRQSPEAGTVVDESDTLHFWVDLGSTPVEAIDGIGDKMRERLAKVGVRSVGELSLRDAKEISSILKVGEARTRDFVNMAELMSRLTILGLKDEVVELLIKGTDIRSVEDLAKARPTTLYARCTEALESKKVVTPESFSVTKKNVSDWVNAAKDALG